MPLKIESLRRILEYEKKNGYRDKAVIGGVDKFLHNWSAEAVVALTTPVQRTRFRKLKLDKAVYATLTPEERTVWAKQVLNFLESVATGKKSNTTKETPVKKPAVRKSKPALVTTVHKDLPESPITVIKGISTSLAAKFKKLNVQTVRELLYFFPNRHADYSQCKFISQLVSGNEETIIANVWQATEVRPGGRRSTEAIVGDETGNIRIIWFNNPYLVKKLTTNMHVVISGKVSLFQGQHVFQSPEWEIYDQQETVHTGRLVPFYPLTAGLTQRRLRKLMKEVIDRYSPFLVDMLPADIISRRRLMTLNEAVNQAHFPDDEDKKKRARLRLAFDELLLLQLGVMNRKRSFREEQPGNPLKIDRELLKRFSAVLPFNLTAAQQKVLREIMTDLQQPQLMSRLLQGDVGSGKTVVAVIAMLVAAANGFQSALMAPTEILAEQHFKTICGLLSLSGKAAFNDTNAINTYEGLLDQPLKVALLTGSTSTTQKQQVQKQITSGNIDIAIGTHALIQKGVSFKQLGLAVIDEQHRFGVEQRSALRGKGYHPHVLVMTATPIPRTLALTLYGDLDLSVIDKMPPGRLPIKTKWLKPAQRSSGYAFIRKEIQAGHQAFIICPLVEESDLIAARAAVAQHEFLTREVFPNLKLGLLHGRMKGTEKERVMREFHEGKLDILVSTPVVEVGIDVPNASVMLVESANRFGLSQLHQFRGRVGRGQAQSYCMLLADNPSEVSRKRLAIIENTQDGFVLAEEDLKLRGPGEFFGTRQSGIPDLRMAKMSDSLLLEVAREEATVIFEKDPKLQEPQNMLLSRELRRIWPQAGEWS